MFERFKLDSDAYHHGAQTGPCFICEIVARNPEYPAHIVHEDAVAIALLDKYPPLYGHTLIAPRDHREQVAGDFTVEEYLDLQRRVYAIANAVQQEVGAERIYLYAFGSNQGNSHVHWHVAPLPPGVPYREQQIAAIRQDPLQVPEEERASLAARLRRRITGTTFQDDPKAIRWRVHLRSPIAKVYRTLSTDAGRASFWAESAIERDGVIHFVFPNDVTWDARVLRAVSPRLYAVQYYGNSVTTFELEEDGHGGTDLTLTDRGVPPEHRTEVIAGWVSVLMALKAAVDFGVDLRAHDSDRHWDSGYVEN